ncbi:MAG: NAD(P)/FAD-dependent oxidoreductase [Candidatus Syntropharchaeales archaeon]
MPRRIVIIGGGVAGINTMEEIMKLDPDARITTIKKERIASFSTCGMIYALHGTYPLSECILQEKEAYIEKDIDFRSETTVTGINCDENYIAIGDEKIPYDYLVIATGRKQKIPPIAGTDLEGVYRYSNEEDAAEILEVLDQVENAVIIGAGIIGLQAANAFADRGIRTTVVEALPSLLPTMLDSDMAEIVQNKLEEAGIRFIMGEFVQSIDGKERVVSVSVKAEKISADMVVLAAGMQPNIDLALDAGIEIGEFGGILTDTALRVKRKRGYLENVYALGDCIEVIDGITNRPRLSMLASTAVIQARLVANNICGKNKIYNPVLSPAVTVLGGLQVGSVGITSEMAKRYGIDIIIGKSKKLTRARYYPGRKPITLKLIFDHNRKLIGAQAVSEETVPGRIDAFTIAISKGLTVDELVEMERCFEPALSFLTDVTIDAARDAISRM